MSATVTARGPLKVVAVIDPAELLDLPVPDGKPRVALTIRLPHGTVFADLATKSVRRAIATVREHARRCGAHRNPLEAGREVIALLSSITPGGLA